MDAKMEQLILDARRVKASDIHITEGMPVWYRAAWQAGKKSAAIFRGGTAGTFNGKYGRETKRNLRFRTRCGLWVGDQ